MNCEICGIVVSEQFDPVLCRECQGIHNEVIKQAEIKRVVIGGGSGDEGSGRGAGSGTGRSTTPHEDPRIHVSQERDGTEKRALPSERKALKFNKGKPSLSLVPSALHYGAARAYDFGAIKYAAYNFRQGLLVREMIDATLRHMQAFIDGVIADEESGLDPLDHAAAELGMLMDTMERIRAGKLPDALDNRFKE